MLTATPEVGMRDEVPGSKPGTAVVAEDEVLVVSLVPHKVGPPTTRPDTRVKYWPGQQYVCNKEDAAHAQARGIVHVLSGKTFDWWGAPGRVLSPLIAGGVPRFTHETPGALRIAQGVGYDPGSAAYRFHTALNAKTKHASAFIRWGDTNPHMSLRQLDGEAQAGESRDAVLTADVLHNHIGYFLLNNTGVQRRDDQVLVMHYHGSRPDGRPLCGDRMPGTRMSYIEFDHARGAKVVCARLSLVEEVRSVATEKGLPIVPAWLPIPMDVAGYRALVPKIRRPGPFRIAHSPTNRRFKGSDVYDAVLEKLRAKGVPVESVTIMGRSHADALLIKADCDAVFDSFWLGMQGSGLEGAAMGLPVVAGDATVRDVYLREYGACPYTFAHDAASLAEVIERLVMDAQYYNTEAARVAAFVEAHHDYAAVGARYETLLAGWTERNDVFTGAQAGVRSIPPRDPATNSPMPRKRRRL